jgi:hypothetical protein
MTPSFSRPHPRNWKQLYLDALFESDKAAIPGKIGEAYRAMVTRRQQLLSFETSNVPERQALDNALFSLRALQTCLALPVTTAA